jgi:hypothetical protein
MHGEKDVFLVNTIYSLLHWAASRFNGPRFEAEFGDVLQFRFF